MSLPKPSKTDSRLLKHLWVESPRSLASTIVTTTDAQEAVKQADLVVEAIVENLEVKRKLFSSLDSYAPEHCIFATNTSSLSVTEIADSTGENRRSAPQMKLVEVIRTSDTSDATNAALLDVCKRMQKTSVSCKDTPGLVPYMLEAVRMLERGDATAEDIDTAMKLGAGYREFTSTVDGRLILISEQQLWDLFNLRTLWGWTRGALSPELVQPIKALEEKVKEGKLGRKTGEGFFKY
ncbi:Short chain 3-hydroxyacyl-CoA dehydrogenase [Rhizoctonia solani AG-1 IA]|uniref:Short chain 3-hydroxyacyl-CoA dehydrogenase n=1 Tax=Thanatephorus cucumeris (strain AG1-IA) TaxID=983506 RepID=L8X3I3_THACA|nr:Short chain 3-hydroxyacyl-CoA dehydrogenase [Rhizoctonia solani AG-1 IA]